MVVGAGLGGLSAAVYLRLAGRDVRVLEANAQTGGRANRIEWGGYRFDTGPSLLNYPWVFEAFFAAAGRRLRDAVDLLPVDPSIRFRWPDGTSLELGCRADALRETFERIEPGSAGRLAAFLADAERKYHLAFRKLVTTNEDNPLRWFGRMTPRELLATAAWRSLYGELGRFFRSRYLREALGSYAMYLGGSPWQLPGLFSILPYGEIAYGLWLPRGGVYALVEAMTKLALELGVDVRTGCPVARIETARGAVRGVALRGGGRIDAPVVVSNVDVPTTRAELLGAPARPPPMTSGVITFYWALRAPPPGLGHHTIFLPSDFRRCFRELQRTLPAEPAFYVSVPTGTDPALAPPGGAAVFVLVPTPVLSRMGPVDGPALVARVRGQVLDRLRREGVEGLPDGILHETVYTPADWRAQFGLFDGSAFGAAHTLFHLGPFRDRNADRRRRGLYYVGAGTTPGTGLPLVVLGGRMTAERVAAREAGR